MASWEDVRRIALDLPETAEGTSHGNRSWRVKDEGFVWERPLRRGDLEALGEAAPDGPGLGARASFAPDGPVLGVRTEHLGAKEAILASDPEVFFTTPHFDGYPAVLVQLEKIEVKDLEEVIVEAWLVRAPKRLAREYLDRR